MKAVTQYVSIPLFQHSEKSQGGKVEVVQIMCMYNVWMNLIQDLREH